MTSRPASFEHHKPILESNAFHASRACATRKKHDSCSNLCHLFVSYRAGSPTVCFPVGRKLLYGNPSRLRPLLTTQVRALRTATYHAFHAKLVVNVVKILLVFGCELVVSAPSNYEPHHSPAFSDSRSSIMKLIASFSVRSSSCQASTLHFLFNS